MASRCAEIDAEIMRILLQVPGIVEYQDEELPPQIENLLNICSYNTLLNILMVCLKRLFHETILKQNMH